ncbi:MAG TPA: hypothetical protein VE863_15540 [Pyrinomonadaceae bacterium]|jgi:chromosome segregation ATPase|nr:hypothetical protein [Pyrinomonadaceae bacterium]
MDDEPTKDLATRAFQMRVLNEFAAVRTEQAAMRADITEIRADTTEIRADIVEIRTQQFAMAKHISALDSRLSSLEQRVDERLKETSPIWEALQDQMKKLDQKFDLVIKDLYEMRGDVALHHKRIGEIEHRLLPPA